jgi:hypothetical protein
MYLSGLRLRVLVIKRELMRCCVPTKRLPSNKQLQRTVEWHRGDAARSTSLCACCALDSATRGR